MAGYLAMGCGMKRRTVVTSYMRYSCTVAHMSATHTLPEAMNASSQKILRANESERMMFGTPSMRTIVISSRSVVLHFSFSTLLSFAAILVIILVRFFFLVLLLVDFLSCVIKINFHARFNLFSKVKTNKKSFERKTIGSK